MITSASRIVSIARPDDSEKSVRFRRQDAAAKVFVIPAQAGAGGSRSARGFRSVTHEKRVERPVYAAFW